MVGIGSPSFSWKRSEEAYLFGAKQLAEGGVKRNNLTKPRSFFSNIPCRSSPQMPKLIVESVGEFEVPAGKRLVLALSEECGIDQLHACGGNARCTTCRVEFLSGAPEKITVAEQQLLAARGLSGVRLSCQILCEGEMHVRAISRLEGSGRKDCGAKPAEELQPQPVQWV